MEQRKSGGQAVGQIDVTKIDPFPEEDAGLDGITNLWFTDLVDILNNALLQLQNAITPTVLDIPDDGGGAIRVVAIALSPNVEGLTINSIATVYLVSSSNPVTILSVVTGVDEFTVTFVGDPGASAVISYLLNFVD